MFAEKDVMGVVPTDLDYMQWCMPIGGRSGVIRYRQRLFGLSLLLMKADYSLKVDDQGERRTGEAPNSRCQLTSCIDEDNRGKEKIYRKCPQDKIQQQIPA